MTSLNSTDWRPPRPDATSLIAEIRAGVRSSRQVVDEACQRLAAADEVLGVVANQRYAEALAEADAVAPGAPLAGIPIVAKDSMGAVSGHPLTEAWNVLRDHRPAEDTSYIKALRDAGAIVIATVTASQFASLSTAESELFGATRNPWNTGLSTGGSSGGSAAAVAVGAVPIAHGTDVGGSIRIPSSCCGTFGFKPSRGATPVSDAGVASDLWSEHCLTRTVRDSALVLDLTATASTGDRERFVASTVRPGRRLRIGVSHTHYGEKDPVGAAVIERTVDLLERLGHTVVVAEPQYDRQRLETAFMDLVAAGQLHRVRACCRSAGAKFAIEALEPATRSLVEIGLDLGPDRLGAARATLDEERRRIERWFDGFDVWLCSTIVGPPRPLGFLATDGSIDATTVMQRDADISPLLPVMNCAGLPGMSCPLQFSDGLPAGAHFSAARGHDAMLLTLAAELERASDSWHTQVPPLS